MTSTLSCLSFNIWDLPVWLPKANPQKRLARMPEAIGALAPDLICLQESFRITNRRRLLSALPQRFHSAGSGQSRWMLPFVRADRTGGLALLSRFSFEEHRFVAHARFARMRLDERLGQKGFVLGRIRVGDAEVHVVNVHLYAGRTASDRVIRLQQLDSLFTHIGQYCPGSAPVILAGDFNASPSMHFPLSHRHEPTPEYERIISEGFVDTLSGAGAEAVTYTGWQNVQAKLLYDTAQIAQRFDYVFYRSGDKYRMETLEARVVFNNGHHLSDHNGVFCRLKISEHRPTS